MPPEPVHATRVAGEAAFVASVAGKEIVFDGAGNAGLFGGGGVAGKAGFLVRGGSGVVEPALIGEDPAGGAEVEQIADAAVAGGDTEQVDGAVGDAAVEQGAMEALHRFGEETAVDAAGGPGEAMEGGEAVEPFAGLLGGFGAVGLDRSGSGKAAVGAAELGAGVAAEGVDEGDFGVESGEGRGAGLQAVEHAALAGGGEGGVVDTGEADAGSRAAEGGEEGGDGFGGAARSGEEAVVLDEGGVVARVTGFMEKELAAEPGAAAVEEGAGDGAALVGDFGEDGIGEALDRQAADPGPGEEGGGAPEGSVGLPVLGEGGVGQVGAG